MRHASGALAVGVSHGGQDVKRGRVGREASHSKFMCIAYSFNGVLSRHIS